MLYKPHMITGECDRQSLVPPSRHHSKSLPMGEYTIILQRQAIISCEICERCRGKRVRWRGKNLSLRLGSNRKTGKTIRRIGS